MKNRTVTKEIVDNLELERGEGIALYMGGVETDYLYDSHDARGLYVWYPGGDPSQNGNNDTIWRKIMVEYKNDDNEIGGIRRFTESFPPTAYSWRW